MGRMNELAFYTLAGAPQTPRELIAEVEQGEALGLGSVFISERFNIKEAATLSGAVGAVSTELGIATAATNHNTRHPMRKRQSRTRATLLRHARGARVRSWRRQLDHKVRPI